MESEFTYFPQLPPEIRHQIWEHALALYWSYSKIHSFYPKTGQVSRIPKLLGEVHLEVSQTCKEARAVAARGSDRHFIEHWGCIDFARHVFFCRNSGSDHGFIKTTDERYHWLQHVQHLVINPTDWGQTQTTISFFQTRCTSLRSIVVIGPYFEPPPAEAPEDDLFLMPWEDFDPLFKVSPTEFDVRPLLAAIQKGPESMNEDRQRYRRRLLAAEQRFPRFFDGLEFEEEDSAWWMTRRQLERLQRALGCFAKPPGVLVRQRQELAASRGLGGRWLPQAEANPNLPDNNNANAPRTRRIVAQPATRTSARIMRRQANS